MGEVPGGTVMSKYTFNLNNMFRKIDDILNETPCSGESKIVMRPCSNVGNTIYHYRKETIYGAITCAVTADKISAVVKIELAGFGEFLTVTSDGNLTVHTYNGEVDYCTSLFLDGFVHSMELYFH